MAEASVPQIPDRLFFRIGDVSELAGVESYVLRFWETEFPMLAPKKAGNGQRQYRRKDVETVLEIKRLLYDEGYTIAGARKVLSQRSKRKRPAPAPSKRQPLLPLILKSKVPSETLAPIKKELRDILSLLAKD